MNANKKLAKTVFSTRIKKAKTQLQLATEAGLGRRTIQRVENADMVTYNPKLSTLLKLASALKKPVGSLIQ